MSTLSIETTDDSADYHRAFAAMIVDLRSAQAAITSARPSLAEVDTIRGALAAVVERCRPYRVAEADQIAGRLWDMPGRAQALIPPLLVVEASDTRVVSTTWLDRFHLGVGAAHGGVVASVLDEALGRMVVRTAPTARTVQLDVSYRGLVPIETELTVEAVLDRVQGRKVFAHCSISDPSGVLLSRADSVFVAPHPPAEDAT